ncbi:hypothetical protein PR202_ga29585 [Eleusine coracana subsp. coracana]|uniref:F-box domain-containing protein n=1 Tax=Eleusine coracana subsp. coracana TaxID=191504 RepID=A0AAV5DKE1_ELECO|nr:hypothetical protein PR202_ga29585 [Eleusine coracana subsp. coracana]
MRRAAIGGAPRRAVQSGVVNPGHERNKRLAGCPLHSSARTDAHQPRNHTYYMSAKPLLQLPKRVPIPCPVAKAASPAISPTMASRDAVAAWEALTSTDDLLGDILIRLPTLADLGRAAASYTAFRRAIVDPAFLRRLHARHPPSLLGLHTFAGFHRRRPLPRRDATLREGRIDDTFITIAVCDPLFRRYVLLPPIPEDLVAAVKNPHSVNTERRCLVFLAHGGKAEAPPAAGMPEPFRVVWMAQCRTKLVAFVFSSTDGQWRKIPSSSWRDLDPDMASTTPLQSLACGNHGYRCFYWMLIKSPLPQAACVGYEQNGVLRAQFSSMVHMG